MIKRNCIFYPSPLHPTMVYYMKDFNEIHVIGSLSDIDKFILV